MQSEKYIKEIDKELPIMTVVNDVENGKYASSTKRSCQEKSYEEQANIISTWTLSFLNPLLKLGSEKALEMKDLGVPTSQDCADRNYEICQQVWDNERKKHAKQSEEQILRAERRGLKKPFTGTPKLFRALLNGFGVWNFVYALAIYIISTLLQFVPVLILNDLVQYFEKRDNNEGDLYDGYAHPWVEVAALGILPVLVAALQTRSTVIFTHCAVFARTGLSMLLYRKSMLVSAAGRATTSVGQVVNMMSNDTNQVQSFINFIGFTAAAPIQIVISLVFIYKQVGVATWVGVAFMVGLAPFNLVIFAIVGKLRRQVLKYSDQRVKMMNELLTGIRIIKFYAWERPFQKEVRKIREEELQALTKLAYVIAVGFSIVLLSAPIIQPILVFLTYVKIEDTPLTAAMAFTTLALFSIMRFPFAFLPMGILNYVQCMISIRRISTYLMLPELQPYVIDGPHPDDVTSSNIGSITMKNASFTWGKAPPAPIPPQRRKRRSGKKSDDSTSTGIKTEDALEAESNHSASSDHPAKTILKELTISIKPGDLVAIVGTVGSGKSSFLSAILGEMESVDDSKIYRPTSSTINSKEFCGYSAQTPWVVNDTLKGNILFGREFDEERYEAIKEACALTDDIKVLPGGDMTEIGERGINLSGGQKARVSLARALYSKQTELLLLDDPLSAVDSNVSEHLFEHAIAGPIAHKMTRLLVTHHVHYLHRCDSVIVLDGGEIVESGTFDELVAKGVEFAGAIEFDDQTSDQKDDAKPSLAQTKEVASTDGKEIKNNEKMKAPSKDAMQKAKKEGKLLSVEEREEGNVSGSMYAHFARAGGLIPAFGVVFIAILGRSFEVG
mmetsp:Transcript_47257/g.55175  ORF Transcript_47257/g.55175 Transcript_47257/m.55175 type:complete len:842 (+) Transcript_47257:159-2684(+)